MIKIKNEKKKKMKRKKNEKIYYVCLFRLLSDQIVNYIKSLQV